MIRIENIDVYGWEPAIRGMRNPLNSWAKSDSKYNPLEIGPNDLDLMHRLVKSGNDHAKFLRMITVTMDVTAPLYWWKEADTYKVGTVANSCSTMHKVTAKEFTQDDFSIEHLGISSEDGDPMYRNLWPAKMAEIISALNIARNCYLRTNDEKLKKEYWWQIIQMLPTSYNQRRTVQMNYQVLRNIYHSRKNHKLDEWHDFCRMIESLPYAELITGETR